jgi:hypothetical protein
MKDKMFGYWVRFGIKMKWVSPIVCSTHIGTYEYESEEARAEWDEGLDPCTHVMVVLE